MPPPAPCRRHASTSPHRATRTARRLCGQRVAQSCPPTPRPRPRNAHSAPAHPASLRGDPPQRLESPRRRHALRRGARAVTQLRRSSAQCHQHRRYLRRVARSRGRRALTAPARWTAAARHSRGRTVAALRWRRNGRGRQRRRVRARRGPPAPRAQPRTDLRARGVQVPQRRRLGRPRGAPPSCHARGAQGRQRPPPTAGRAIERAQARAAGARTDAPRALQESASTHRQQQTPNE